MARPRLAKEDKRTARFPTTRCTDNDLVTVRRLASETGLAVTAYIRAVATGYEPSANDSGVPPDVILELRRIGNNLNQAVKKFHQTGEPPKRIEAVATKLDYLIDGLIAKHL